MTDHTFDIIIPTYHPGEQFSELLSMLKKQTVRPTKIILMETLDDGETLKEFQGCECYPVKKEDFDHAATRREGISHSSSESFILMTDDAVPADESMCENLMKALFSENKVATAYARQLPKSDCFEAEKFTRSFNYPEESFTKGIEDLPKLGIKTYFASNVCCAYKRDIWNRVGGFVEKAVFNEDMIYSHAVMEAGYKVAYEASARCIHSHNYGMKEQFQRNFDLGASQKMHPEVFDGIQSEGEGIRLVKSTAARLIKCGKWYQIPRLFFVSGAKYLGYRLGKKYDTLPESFVRKCALNKKFFK